MSALFAIRGISPIHNHNVMRFARANHNAVSLSNGFDALVYKPFELGQVRCNLHSDMTPPPPPRLYQGANLVMAQMTTDASPTQRMYKHEGIHIAANQPVQKFIKAKLRKHQYPSLSLRQILVALATQLPVECSCMVYDSKMQEAFLWSTDGAMFHGTHGGCHVYTSNPPNGIELLPLPVGIIWCIYKTLSPTPDYILPTIDF